MPANERSDPARTVSHLQSQLLSSVLRQEPLPGQDRAPHFPDLAFILEAPTVLVADANIPHGLELGDLERPIRIVAESDVREVAARSGDRPYVTFMPAEINEGRIRITMQVRMAPTEPDIHALGLGAITATFVQRKDGTWEADEPPLSVAF